MATWEQIAESVDGQMVAGTLIARIDGKAVVLGQLSNEAMVLTPVGKALGMKLDAATREKAVDEADGEHIELSLHSEASAEDHVEK